jgi:hypothetical protein
MGRINGLETLFEEVFGTVEKPGIGIDASWLGGSYQPVWREDEQKILS